MQNKDEMMDFSSVPHGMGALADRTLDPIRDDEIGNSQTYDWEHLTVPYVPDGDDDDDFPFSACDIAELVRKAECLQSAEDIDFEFVYALHTFVATVEGQANATKGDTMVLLDDSNSYWWLVRVVKDSSIGEIYAQHSHNARTGF